MLKIMSIKLLIVLESIHTWSKCSKQLAHMDVKKNFNANSLSDDSNKACEVALGSYCLNESKQPQSQKKRLKQE